MEGKDISHWFTKSPDELYEMMDKDRLKNHLSAEELLNKVYKMIEDKEEEDSSTDSAIDLIFEEVNKMCWVTHPTKDRTIIDNLLEKVDFDKINLTLMISFLTATIPVKHELKNRKDFYNKTHKVASNMGKNANRLLQGLES